MKRLIACAALAASLTLGTAATGSAAVNLAGKTITVLIAFSPGGPVDIFGRLIAAHLKTHLPGNPTVVVQNKPGAGGVVAASYLYNVARKDGSMMLVTIAPFTNQFIGKRKVKFDAAKFYWLGSLNISQSFYMHKSLGAKAIGDLSKIDKQIVIGGLRPSASRDLRMRSFLEALGIKNYKYVIGYRGTRPIRNALLRGEVNFSDESVTALATGLASHVKDGTVIPLAQSGLTRGSKRIRDPRVPDLPTATEAMVALKGKAILDSVPLRGMRMVESMVALGRAILMPPGVDPNVAATVRAAVDSLDADPAFQKDAKRMTGGTKMELVKGADAQKFADNITTLVKADPAAVAYLRGLGRKKP
jgi:tripartite-type tricarboxylate transporter receptor subunit TctC